MTQQIAVVPLEEWAGVTDPVERRKRQNRLNQRARRQRERQQSRKQIEKSLIHVSKKVEVPQEDNVEVKVEDVEQISCMSLFGPGEKNFRDMLSRLEANFHAEYSTGSPRADSLLNLVRLNVRRAFIANIDVLRLDAASMHDDAISLFCTVGSWYTELAGVDLPATLQPTKIQQTIAHHPWFDLIPSSKLRDNLISAVDTFDDEELCSDMCGDSRTSTQYPGVIVWKDPWDPTGWEITEAFLQKWSWALKDCWDLFQSTNTWRIARGERPLLAIDSS